MRGKIVEPIYKKEIREIPYCPTCGLRLEGSGQSYFVDTLYQCKCGYWTVDKDGFNLTKGYY